MTACCWRSSAAALQAVRPVTACSARRHSLAPRRPTITTAWSPAAVPRARAATAALFHTASHPTWATPSATRRPWIPSSSLTRPLRGLHASRVSSSPASARPRPPPPPPPPPPSASYASSSGSSTPQILVALLVVITSGCFLYDQWISDPNAAPGYTNMVANAILGRRDGAAAAPSRLQPGVALAPDAVQRILYAHARVLQPTPPLPGSAPDPNRDHAPRLQEVHVAAVASNDPIEDAQIATYLPETGGYLFGVVDGHSGPECGRAVAHYLPAYIAQSLGEDHVNEFAPEADAAARWGLGALLKRLRPHKKAEFEKKLIVRHDLKPGSEAEEARVEHVAAALKHAFLRLDHDIVNGGIGPVAAAGAAASDATAAALHPRERVVQELRTALSGACCLVAYVEGAHVWVAVVGDSRAVLGRQFGLTGQVQAVPLSIDQTARNPQENSRLIEAHSRELETVVSRGRLLGSLMPTRAFGDARYKWPLPTAQVVTPHSGRRMPRHYYTPPYVTAEPEVAHYRLDGRDQFLALASDGIYDHLTNDEVAELAAVALQNQDAAADAAAAAAGPGATAPAAPRPPVLPMTPFGRAVLQGQTAAPEPAASGPRDAHAGVALIYGALAKPRTKGVDPQAAPGGTPLAHREQVQKLLAISAPYSRRYRDDMTVLVLRFQQPAAPLGAAGDRPTVPSETVRPLTADEQRARAAPKPLRLEQYTQTLAGIPVPGSDRAHL